MAFLSYDALNFVKRPDAKWSQDFPFAAKLRFFTHENTCPLLFTTTLHIAITISFYYREYANTCKKSENRIADHFTIQLDHFKTPPFWFHEFPHLCSFLLE